MNLENKILEILKGQEGIPLTEDQLHIELAIADESKNELKACLVSMVEEGRLIQTKKRKYGIPEDFGYLAGRLQGNAKGFGFLIPDNKDSEDVFIPADKINGALHKDRVMVKVLKTTGDFARSKEGEVVRILERANRTIVGTFELEKHFGFVIP
ncbi:MAG: hypothetical protein WBI89_01920, partial [Caldicoprobacterales bacterium]